MWAAWISIIIVVITSVITIASAFTYLKAKVAELEKNEENNKLTHIESAKRLELAFQKVVEELQNAMKESQKNLQEAIILLKVSTAEQAIINKITSGVLSSLTDKLEVLEDKTEELKRARV